MHKHLGLITVVCFAAALVLLGAAWMMMGPMGLADFAVGLASARLPSCGEQAGTTTSRAIRWDGSTMAATALPAMMRWQPGSGESVEITGDATLVKHIVLDGGEIKLDCRPGRLQSKLDITLPGARRFHSFSLAGITNLILTAIDQDELSFNLAGSSIVTATGRADTIHINAAGLSDARLGGVASKDVHLNLAGASKVAVAPSDSLHVNSVGAATVTLLSEPQTVDTHIVGAGKIVREGK